MKKDKIKKSLSQKEIKCGVITCIHNADNACDQEKCEIFERTLKQEY